MSKLSPELKQRIYAYNREKAVNKEKAEDFMRLLAALPPGQVKNLLKDETCGAILKKYGVT